MFYSDEDEFHKNESVDMFSHDNLYNLKEEDKEIDCHFTSA